MKKLPPLTALSYAAILTVYAAGYERTREAADRFVVELPASPPARSPQPPLPSPAPAVARPKSPVAAPESTVARVEPVPTPVLDPAPPARRSEHVEPVERPEPVEPVEPIEPAESVAPVTPGAAAPSAAAPSTVPPSTVPPLAPAAPVPPVPVAAPIVLKSGRFIGRGSCRHGDIEAEVQINHGQIIDVKITRCLVQYDCGDLYDLNEAILAHQGPTADYIAGSTQSTIAFYTAIFNAIDKAK